MLAFGGMSGVISWLPVYPIDIIKSRIQSDQTGKMYTGAPHPSSPCAHRPTAFSPSSASSDA
jgi:hypothetical protein